MGSSPPAGTVGTIYLLHFDRPYGTGRHGRARHYLGWTHRDVIDRVNEHLGGEGSPLVAAAAKAGIHVELVATWRGDRDEERRMHNLKATSRQLCPTCIAQRKAQGA